MDRISRLRTVFCTYEIERPANLIQRVRTVLRTRLPVHPDDIDEGAAPAPIGLKSKSAREWPAAHPADDNDERNYQ